MLAVPQPIDTRPLFRPVSRALAGLLRELPPDAWMKPTIAGSWLVRDIVAHMLDTSLRRLSFHRDGLAPPPPGTSIESARDFVAFINHLNAQWVEAAQRLSPRVLTDLLDRASTEVADWFESVPLDGPAMFGVSWAGEDVSASWFDLGREFTELWHHQQQIRMAVGAESLPDPRYLAAVLDIAMRGLPHAFKDVSAAPGQEIGIDVAGQSGGQWALARTSSGWTLLRGRPSTPVASLRVSDEDAWQLLFNALPAERVDSAIRIEGDARFGHAFLRARSVVV